MEELAYDVEGRIGAGGCGSSEESATQRNGHRHRALDARIGTLDLEIPELREGSYFPRLAGAGPDDTAGARGGDPGGPDPGRTEPRGR